jgi:hypothetical protein
MLNKGKQERKYHEFLGKKYRVDSLPCGVSIPFEVELNKVREESLAIVNNIDPKTLKSSIFNVLEKYLSNHPKEAQDQILQMVRALSVITEFFTDGEITEEYINKNATPDEVSDFIEALQEEQHEKTLKKLKEMRKSLLLEKLSQEK